MTIIYYICGDCKKKLGFLSMDDIILGESDLGEQIVKINGCCCNEIE